MTKRLLTSSALAREAEIHRNSVTNLVKRGVLVPEGVLSDGTRIFNEAHVPIARAAAEKFRTPRSKP